MNEETIICPNCAAQIPLSQAIRGRIEDTILKVERDKHRIELEQMKKNTVERAKALVKDQYEGHLKSMKEDAEEQRTINKKQQEQLVEFNKQVRQMLQEQDTQKLEMERKLTEAQAQIREDAKKQMAEEHRLKDMEKDKKLQEAIHMNSELSRKLEQGSQQTQGEVLELDLELRLREEFPFDEITEVRKGQRGADIVQLVKSMQGVACGTILWETKNGTWQPSWVAKFKQDIREANANIGILVSYQTTQEIGELKQVDGSVWVVRPAIATRLAVALRTTLLQIDSIQRSSAGKDEQMEVLYKYLVGPEFKHRIEAIVESYSHLQGEIEKEKRWYTLKWAREEKAVRSVIDNTLGMYGDLQGVTNRALPAIKNLELPEPQEDVVESQSSLGL